MKTVYFMGDDNTIRRLSAAAIVEKSNLVDNLEFATPMLYNGYDMTEFQCTLLYKLPISKVARIVPLTLANASYVPENITVDGPCLMYQLPNNELTTSITSETGDVEFTLMFTKVSLDPDTGDVKKQVRNSNGSGIIKVLPLRDWFTATDAALSDLASIITENTRIANLLLGLADALNVGKADGIVLDEDTDSIYLTANGTRIGSPIDLETLNQHLVDIGGSSSATGNVSIQQI